MKHRKLKILFRTSGGRAKGKQLGLGHIYRCLNLAQYLKSNEIFFLIEDYGGAKEIIKKRGFKQIIKLKKNIDYSSDLHQTIDFIIKENIDIIIVDIYKIRLSYLTRLRDVAKLVVISDLKRVDYEADLVVNGFVGFKNGIVFNKKGSKCLLGSKYQILHRKFSSNSSSKKKFRLIASFGGYDEKNISQILIDELEKLDSKFKTKIILGLSTKLNKKIIKKEYIKILKYSEDMKKEIAESEYGLCSGGITTYEFASQKIPFGIISQVPHQLITSKEWSRKKMAINLGLIGLKTRKRLRDFLKMISSNELRTSTHALKICDGKGANRVAKQIISLKIKK